MKAELKLVSVEKKALFTELRTVESQARAAHEVYVSLLQTDSPRRHQAKELWERLHSRASRLEAQIRRLD